MSSFDKYLEDKTANNAQLSNDLEKLSVAIDIASQVFDLRVKRNLTQEELAQKLGLKQPHIARWERPGYQAYTFNSLNELAVALDARLVVKFEPREATGSANLSTVYKRDIDNAVQQAEYETSDITASTMNKWSIK